MAVVGSRAGIGSYIASCHFTPLQLEEGNKRNVWVVLLFLSFHPIRLFSWSGQACLFMEDVKKKKKSSDKRCLNTSLRSHHRSSYKLMLQVGAFIRLLVWGKFKMLLNAVAIVIWTSERCGWRGYWTWTDHQTWWVILTPSSLEDLLRGNRLKIQANRLLKGRWFMTFSTWMTDN